MVLRIEEYLKTLPENVLNGEDVQLSEKSLREIFKFVELDKNDILYHLGCSNEKGVEIAINEYKVKKAVGIDNNLKKIQKAFLYCYYDKQETSEMFSELSNDKSTNFSRYNFFHANYLKNKNKNEKVREKNRRYD